MNKDGWLRLLGPGARIVESSDDPVLDWAIFEIGGRRLLLMQRGYRPDPMRFIIDPTAAQVEALHTNSWDVWGATRDEDSI